jgi:hypothetical protein
MILRIMISAQPISETLLGGGLGKAHSFSSPGGVRTEDDFDTFCLCRCRANPFLERIIQHRTERHFHFNGMRISVGNRSCWTDT